MLSKNLHRVPLTFKAAIRHACFATFTQSQPIIQLPANSSIFSFGASNNVARPLLCTNGVEWKVNTGEAWAIVGRGKNVIFQTLLGHTRISPTPQHGLYPSMYDIDPYPLIKFVSFRHTGALTGGATGGEFYDYTARYGAKRDGDEKTLSQNLFDMEGGIMPSSEQVALIESLGLTELLSIPLIALSNGQMRRARIARALFKKPELLLLDEPLTGLDSASRTRLIRLLGDFKSAPGSSPKCITGLRLQEVVDLKHDSARDIAPDYVTHIFYVEGETVWAGRRQDFFKTWEEIQEKHSSKPSAIGTGKPVSIGRNEAKLVIDLKGVNVKYGERRVLNDINWQVRQGECWHLHGANGSGKTTLLSLLTGDHPQSYTQSHLLLPSLQDLSSTTHRGQTWHVKQRKRTPTAHLRSLIGIVSPELFDAFPRRHPGMTVWDAVQTGFSGGFVPAGKGVGQVEANAWSSDTAETAEGNKWRAHRCWEVLEALGPAAWDSSSPNSTIEISPSAFISPSTHSFASKSFTSLAPGEQRLVLLMRALVGRPPLVILDEVWSGMEENMIAAVKSYLRGTQHAIGNGPSTRTPGLGPDQAVIVVTHWEEEVPWNEGEGLKRFRLEGGSGRILAQ